MSINIKQVLKDKGKYGTILVVIGPEGGFTTAEEKLLISKDFISTTLGENVLRAETVPLYILSVISYEFMR
jgi:16S rRNA (uracil1498-N3)-methyltransferase